MLTARRRNAGPICVPATGTVVKFPGHTAVYLEGTDKELGTQKRSNEQDVDDESERQLPVLVEGEALRLVSQEGQTQPGLTSKQHFTQPPPRYNEALLIKELEEKESTSFHLRLDHLDDSGSQICREGRGTVPSD